MATRRLSVHLYDFTDQAVGVAVTIQLDSATTAAAEGTLPNRYIVPHPITRHTNQQGVAVFDLEPSENLVGRPQYRASWTGGAHAGYLFYMPDSDASLFQVVTQPVLPPPAATLPPAVTEGDYITYEGNEYQAKKPVHAGTAPPTNPARNAIWWDTSVSPPDPRYTLNGGMTWNEFRDPADMAAALNSLTGLDRIDGAHVRGQVVTPIVTGSAPPATTGFRPGSSVFVQPAGQTATGTFYFLTQDTQVSVGNQNRLVFVIANNVLEASPPATDNYENILGSIHYRSVGPDSVLTIRLDTGVGTEPPPDQIWVRGIEPANALSEFRVDIAQPYSYSGGRRYKQLNNVVSASVHAAGINGAQTWLLFTDLGGTRGYDFKPPVITIPGAWVEAGGSGGGLDAAQVRALVADWAEQGNTDLLPDSKLAAGGSTGQVLKRTATGREWAADAGGLDQAAVDTRADARIAAGVEAYARTGQSGTIPTARIGDDQVTRSKIGAGAVGSTELGSNAVVTSKVTNLAVTEAKLASNSVSERTIQDDAVRAAQIQAGAVGTSELATGAVTDGKLATATEGRLMPSGGSDGQVLTKQSGTDYHTAWEDAASGGSGGTPLSVSPQELTFLPSLPSTNIGAVGETQINIAASSVLTGTPFSVTSNGIVVAAGTSAFQAVLDYVLEIDPTGWTTTTPGRLSGGNRLFIDIYWKRDGTILPETRQSHYIRGDEDWAPLVHKIHGVFTERIIPGTYTLWIYRTIAAGGGNEIRDIQIASANSDIKINYENYSGGGGGSSASHDVLAYTPYTLPSASVPITQAFAASYDSVAFGDWDDLIFVFGTRYKFGQNAPGVLGFRTFVFPVALLSALTGTSAINLANDSYNNATFQVTWTGSSRTLTVAGGGTGNPRFVYIGLRRY